LSVYTVYATLAVRVLKIQKQKQTTDMNGDQPTQSNPDPAAAPAPPQPPVQGSSNQKPAVIEKIKGANSILVAISANPSIDQLAAAIALTLLLEKYKKNATAVFSGKIPSALEFLKPGETFEKNTDSLRDFIIAIDKSKADKLRYKVEDNVVKIFITPYKTSITEKDLQYNAGDFNVDVIVALGVKHQQDLDTAITTHGRIFHDAVVVSINNAPGGDFGIANWEDQTASSLSELITQLATELGADILDADIATALLSGIVAETSRFSNSKTTPETMNVSSQLLQAGADQQLVNQQLESVISTDVNLEAGTEIKPTMSVEQLDTEFPHNEEELVIGSDGSLTPAAEPEDLPDDALVEEGTPTSEDKPAEPAAEANSEVVTEAAPIEPPAEAPDADDAEAARKAVEDALKNATAEADTIPAINVVEAPTVEPVPTETIDTPDAPPLVQPGPGPNASPVVPPIGSEPAPLSMSPADQAFTMPMPPTSSMTQTLPVVLGPGSPAPDTTAAPPPLPPPLPPPMMPPSPQ